MPPRDHVHPDFDGHHERPFSELTPEERLDWVWECMVLLHAGREHRARRRAAPRTDRT
jgi:hypothetical protein